MPRTRTKSVPYASYPPRTGIVAPDGSWASDEVFGPPGTFNLCEEYMEDEDGPSRRSKPCVHIKSETSGQWGTYLEYDPWLPPGYSRRSIIWPSIRPYQRLPTVEVTLSQAKAVQNMMKGNLNDQVLAPVVVKELPQLKTLHRDLLFGGFGVKSFANRYLAYKFGLVPFLSDLKHLVHGYGAIRDHIKYIDERYHTVVKTSMAAGSVTGKCYGSFPWLGSVRTHCTLKVVRRYDAHDRIRMILDYYGSSLLDVVWEVIPYSFIVDWFVDVGNLLHYVSPQFQRPACEVIDICTNTKASCSFVAGEVDRYGQPQEGPTISHRYFRRQTCDLGPSAFLGDGLTFARAPIAGALLLQKLL